MEYQEINKTALESALSNLPEYEAPHFVQENLEDSMPGNTMKLPQLELPLEIWDRIEAHLPGQTFQMPTVPLPIDIWDKIESQLPAAHLSASVSSQKSAKVVPFFSIRNVALAASVALVLGIGLNMLLNKGNNVNNGMMAFNGKENTETTLPDGTKVRADEHTILRYPKSFSGNERRIIQESGYAYFEVAKDKSKPFIIDCPIADVQAVGTSFTTQLFKDSMIVKVYTGKVKVYNNNNKDTTFLLPDQSATFYTNSTETATTKADDDKKRKATVETQILTYKDEPLLNIIVDLERKYECKIQCDNQDVNNKRITCKIRTTSLKDILETICLAADMKLESKNELFIIK